ncbi:D-glycero-alpha-D-manno-heptose-1,7-bisphosphate 7-phosphatase [Sphingomonas glacialis]|uniref:D,D-heptose 1,7-bisphosphate phosphatase n=1 Tax=Sphingomonas glacialis TaxID=658225 RepID=A0A502FQD4_9SPHN|nr:HAD family hydrolase [Sphingomonas glacialis]TPG51621.1 HAD family hydrolase [Sphingomonas glacialis]
MIATERALFLDRDGVLNFDSGYVGTIDRFEIIPGVADALVKAMRLGYRLIVVTNQSGIARGYYTAADYVRVERHMVAVFAALGVQFTGIYHCPHHPDGVVPDLAFACDCRKPGPGLLLQACADHAIDPLRSIMVGDRPSDLAAGKAAGVGHRFLIGKPTSAEGAAFVSLADLIDSATFEAMARSA